MSIKQRKQKIGVEHNFMPKYYITHVEHNSMPKDCGNIIRTSARLLMRRLFTIKIMKRDYLYRIKIVEGTTKYPNRREPFTLETFLYNQYNECIIFTKRNSHFRQELTAVKPASHRNPAHQCMCSQFIFILVNV